MTPSRKRHAAMLRPDYGSRSIGVGSMRRVREEGAWRPKARGERGWKTGIKPRDQEPASGFGAPSASGSSCGGMPASANVCVS